MISLSADTISFFFSLTGEVSDPELIDACRRLLSDEELARVARFLFPKDQHNCLVTRALLRDLLARATPLAPTACRFVTNRYGKPALAEGLLPAPPHFNLSHCLGMTACALHPTLPLGIDIESRERPVDLALADRYFSTAEAAFIHQQAAAQQQAAFFQIWTLKEAYIKARGLGLSLPLNSFTLLPGRQGIDFIPDAGQRADAWHFFSFLLAGHYQAAVAVPARRLQLRLFHTIPLGLIREVDATEATGQPPSHGEPRVGSHGSDRINHL